MKRNVPSPRTSSSAIAATAERGDEPAGPSGRQRRDRSCRERRHRSLPPAFRCAAGRRASARRPGRSTTPTAGLRDRLDRCAGCAWSDRASRLRRPRRRAAPSAVAASGVATTATDAAAANVALPPIESLTPTPISRRSCSPRSTRRCSARRCASCSRDPHFNVMDGLDTYIDDYSQARSDLAGHRAKLLHEARYIFAPPPTRMNAQGFVEDVPEEELAAHAQAQAAPGAIAADRSGRLAAAGDRAGGTPAAPCRAGGRNALRTPRTNRLPMTRARQIRLPLDAPPDPHDLSLADKRLHLCSCNGTMPLDAAALAKALDLVPAPAVHTMLCQKELAAFAADATGDVVVACTQEARLSRRRRRGGRQGADDPLRQHPRDRRLVGRGERRNAEDRRAARRRGDARARPGAARRLHVRRAAAHRRSRATALKWAKALSAQLAVTVLATDATRQRRRHRAAGAARFPRVLRHAHRHRRLARRVRRRVDAGQSDRPRPVHALQRVHRVCPEHAIDWRYQIDLDRCRDHRQCVAACGAVGAIDFDRSERARRERFDLVLDLRGTPWFAHAPAAAGLLRAGRRSARAGEGRRRARDAARRVREAEVLRYKASICAHSRSKQTGCTQCIDVCSTRAIRADGDHVEVEPHLCMGCGACATVCPSGAMTLRISAARRSRQRGSARCSRPTRRRAAATPASCCTPRRAATPSRGSRAAARGCRRA